MSCDTEKTVESLQGTESLHLFHLHGKGCNQAVAAFKKHFQLRFESISNCSVYFCEGTCLQPFALGLHAAMRISQVYDKNLTCGKNSLDSFFEPRNIAGLPFKMQTGTKVQLMQF